MELTIISALPHYLVGDRVVGIAPVSREIDYLADLIYQLTYVIDHHRRSHKWLSRVRRPNRCPSSLRAAG